MLARPGRLCRAGAAGLCRAAGASQPLAKKAAGPPPTRHFGEDWILFFPGMPGRLGYAGQVRRNCRLRRQFRNFFPGKNPDLGAGYAGQARPGYAGQLGPRSHWQKKACCSPPPAGGLEFFSWEKSRPWRGLGRLQAMPGRRGRGGFYAGQARQDGAAPSRMTV